jgi:hypothetical protein
MLQTADEVDKLDRRSSSRNRYGHRDAVTVLLAYRYGLRAAELVDRRWGAGGLQNGLPARRPGEERHPSRALCAAAKCASSAAISGKARLPVCLRLGTRCTTIGTWLFPDDRAGSHRGRSGYQGARPHAMTCLGLQVGQ